jgi:hypothetical protein
VEELPPPCLDNLYFAYDVLGFIYVFSCDVASEELLDLYGSFG